MSKPSIDLSKLPNPYYQDEWVITNINDKICMTRKNGNKIEVRKLTLWERLKWIIRRNVGVIQ